jgi:DNA-binding GntR family transcriptional regulator
MIQKGKENMTQPALSPVISPSSLEKIAYDAIKEAIQTFRFKPGESLVENDLAHQLNISKTPVREAMSRLEKEGFITKVPYKGYYVTGISHQAIVNMFDIRSVLEGLAVRLATPRFTEEEIISAKVLISEHRKAVHAENILEASRLNRRFHEMIIQCSGNERLIHMLNNLEDHIQRYRTLSNYQSGRLEKSVDEHARILEAIVNRDGVAAEEASRAHILSVSDDLAIQNFDDLVERIVRSTN